MGEIRWHHYIGIVLLSLATLLLELALTRTLSVSNWYHFGFLVVSTALLGFGAAGVTLSLWRKLREEFPLDDSLAYLSMLFAFVSLASFALMQRVPFRPFQLLLDRWQLLYMPLYYVTLAAPFYCSGLAISLLLTRGGRHVNRLYGADLLGAGFGCAGICLVLPALGGSGSVVIGAFFGVMAALAFYSFRSSRLTVFGIVSAVALLVLAFVAERALPIIVIPAKIHPLLPAGQTPIYTKWNSFSRVDVFAIAADPSKGRPDPGYSIIVDSGISGTAIPDLSVGVRNYLANSSGYHPPGLAYVGKQHPKVLIIGSGAGREVLEALYYGASSVTAVEINSVISDVVSNRMAKNWGGLFEQPEVHLVTEDGRSFVRRSKEKYDAILSLQTMSGAALTSGALTLSETYVLTLEAFEDYWNHLTPDGVLLISRPQYQLPKLFSTTRALFDRHAYGNPTFHVLAFRGVVEPFGHREFLTGFLLRKSPLDSADVSELSQRLGIGSHQQWGDTGKPELYYSPFQSPRDSYQSLLVDLLTSPDPARIYASSAELLSPATDDRPFFNERARWSRLNLRALRSVLALGATGDIEVPPVAQITLLILLVQAIGVAAILILLPLARSNTSGVSMPGRWSFLVYFAALGLGFILIEISFIQRFELYLGEPIYTFSVVLAGLLISSGVGSCLAERLQNVTRRKLYVILTAVLTSILLTSFVMPPLLSFTLGFSLLFRIALSLLLVGQLGLLLGLPFSTGLRLVADEAPALVPWAWAVNGFFTVIGSVAAMILGMAVGFSLVFLIAAGSYAFALVAMRSSKTSEFAARHETPGSTLSRTLRPADNPERAGVANA
ncbi:MAG TPA: hypothetical protein VOA64_07720 [Candidatus Dormibacteraeota bacterium]|nr:hypothetical protein [Candidatus Dormibacteraeota bacterium]